MEDNDTPHDDSMDFVGAIVGRWRGIRPDLDPTPMLVIARIARLAALTDDLLRPPFAAAGIANGDFDLLAALRRQDPPHEANPGELGWRCWSRPARPPSASTASSARAISPAVSQTSTDAAASSP